MYTPEEGFLYDMAHVICWLSASVKILHVVSSCLIPLRFLKTFLGSFFDIVIFVFSF